MISKLKKLIDYLAASRLSFVLSDLDKTAEMEIAQATSKEEADQIAERVRMLGMDMTEVVHLLIDKGSED